MPKTTEAPHRPNRKSRNRLLVNITMTPEGRDRLLALCDRRAAEYAARGAERPAVRLQSEIVNELIFLAHQAAGLTRATATTTK